MPDLGQGDSATPGKPATNKTLMAVASVLLAFPLVVMAAVPLYAKEGPVVAGWAFFFWFQMVWVFVTAGCTYAAHRLVLAARGQNRKDIA